MSDFQVGDEAELGPVLMNRFLAEATAAGATVELKGNKAVVVAIKEVPKDSVPETGSPVESAPEEPETPKKPATRRKAPTPKAE